jgi:hypothetical protein
MLGSKSGASIRERLRLARKKGEQLSGSGANTSTPAPTTPKGRKTAPASGVDKKSATKVNNTPRKAKSPKIEIKAEEVEEEQDDGI